jgi:hypothetical protein
MRASIAPWSPAAVHGADAELELVQRLRDGLAMHGYRVQASQRLAEGRKVMEVTCSWVANSSASCRR